MAHHNLGSRRVMSSHLGGFTSKSNKCLEDCFTKLKSSCDQRLTKRILSSQTYISHKSHKPHKEVFERAHKGFYTHPPKTSRWKLASKNRNIRNLKYSCYSPNRMLQFGKLEHLVFPGSVRCGVCVVIVFHSSHLGF
jgi:hypothetical protein